MKLIVGLGNPGREYENTRHNIGFIMLDAIVESLNISFNKNKFDGMYAETIINGEKYLFLKPLKYMNLSGEVVRDYVNFFKIDIKDILVIYDDLDTAIGNYRLRLKGSSGGHNGIKNIELHLNTQVYNRIKFGISNNKLIDTKDYVLGKFSNDDQIIIKQLKYKMVEIFNDYTKISFDNLMNKYN